MFLDPENIRLDTKISIVYHLEAEILIAICFYMVANLKIKFSALFSRHFLLFKTVQLYSLTLEHMIRHQDFDRMPP